MVLCFLNQSVGVSLNDYQVDEACRRTVFNAFKVALTNIILVSFTQLYEERK